jgi:hypothetical protein
MRKPLLILLGLAGILCAEDGATNAPADFVTNASTTNTPSPTPSPTPEMSWTNVPEGCWGEKALPYAQTGLKAWYAETDPKKKEEIRQQVLELANKADATDIGLELFAGKPVAQAELPVPTNAVALPLILIKEWDLAFRHDWEGRPDVIRRIGPKNFELWTPKRGWLFDENSKVLSEAKIPRRDGSGRQWYGAFLADGQWITTDLWERDDRIYLFSKENRIINSFPAGDIAGWGRADSTCTHWVVGVSGYGHGQYTGESSDLRIAPWGWKQRVAHYLKRWHLPVPDPTWKFVEKIKSARDFVDPRNLGSRGIRCGETSESDDRKASISWGEPGHGRWVGWPHYSMNTTGHGWESCIPCKDTDNLGFFPGSRATWVGGNKYPVRLEIDPNQPRREFEYFRSWIINTDGKVLGWLPAERVGDDPDGKRMWFVDEQGRILKVDPDGVVSEVLQPTLPGATGNEAPFAHVLFPDLKLGFFYTKPGHFVLARWN